MIGVPITLLGDLLVVPGFGIVGAATVSLVAYGATAFALAAAYRTVSGIPASDLVPRIADVRIVGNQIREAGSRLGGRRHRGRTNA